MNSKPNSEEKGIRVTLVRSTAGRLKNHRLCVNGLGLRRIGDTAVVQDTLPNRGMIRKASYLLKVEEC
jgi:large subunit ribosomal protein L30